MTDEKTGPKSPHSTVLSVEEDAVIFVFRRDALSPLDDCLYALQPTIPPLTRSSLSRCLQRHGISWLTEPARFSNDPHHKFPGPNTAPVPSAPGRRPAGHCAPTASTMPPGQPGSTGGTAAMRAAKTPVPSGPRGPARASLISLISDRPPSRTQDTLTR